MVFSSHVFVFYFLPIVIGFYYILPKYLKHPFLALMSYIFDSDRAGQAFLVGVGGRCPPRPLCVAVRTGRSGWLSAKPSAQFRKAERGGVGVRGE